MGAADPPGGCEAPWEIPRGPCLSCPAASVGLRAGRGRTRISRGFSRAPTTSDACRWSSNCQLDHVLSDPCLVEAGLQRQACNMVLQGLKGPHAQQVW